MAELTRDKKKTAILAVLALVAVVMGVRLIARPAPVPAAAAQVATPPPADTPPPAEDPGVTKGRTVLAATGEPSQPRVFTRDLFRVHEQHYTRLGVPKLPPPPPAADAKAPPAVDPALEREAIVARVREDAKLLCLQTTLVSDNPTAIINDKPYGLYEKVVVEATDKDGHRRVEFVVESIGPKECILQCGGIRVQLRMKEEKLLP